MKIIAILFAFLFSALVSAQPLNQFIVFGDSLSDNGNLYEYLKHQLPTSPPYFKGRFSNGPVWIELLAKSYYPTTGKDHLLDYAFGGAGVMEGDDSDDGFFTLTRELDSYFLTNDDKASPNSMYVVWIGANNYLAVPDDVEKSLKDVMLGIEHSLVRLADAGAKHILVVDLPDLGLTPAARDFDAVDVLTYLSLEHNARLEQKVNELRNRYPNVEWYFFDVNESFSDMIYSPEKYGFTNVLGTCYEEAVDGLKSHHSILKMVSTVKPKAHLSGDACQGYLFFDPVHPSGAAHQYMADKTRQLLDKHGVVFD
ncbi:MAG: SGNH/GDSL hydrolase family protein [Legionellales bacterium]|nr:SGNH/GDSL hydrolase family protein [Legionellales bacterium]